MTIIHRSIIQFGFQCGNFLVDSPQLFMSKVNERSMHFMQIDSLDDAATLLFQAFGTSS